MFTSLNASFGPKRKLQIIGTLRPVDDGRGSEKSYKKLRAPPFLSLSLLNPSTSLMFNDYTSKDIAFPLSLIF